MRRRWLLEFVIFLGILFCRSAARAQGTPPSASSGSFHTSQTLQKSQRGARADSELDAGAISNGIYSNKTFGFTYKIPAGWVLRTEEMNAKDAETQSSSPSAQSAEAKEPGGRVLLAAFSRPPEARGEEINASILIAAESAAAYPGLKEAAQYLGPITEVARAQGFEVDEEPYEIAVGMKVLVRQDFHKDVGSRVMRQSTLAMLAHRYAVSITMIGGTEDEVEELVDGLEFAAEKK